jgi:hypothetical protein
MRDEMTDKDILRMAHEAGLVFGRPFTLAHLRDFAALVAAAESEACEKLASYGIDPRPATDPEKYLPGAKAAKEAVAKGTAAAIRARRTSTISPATLIDPRGSLGEPIV